MHFTNDNLKYCLLTFDQPTKDHVKFFAKDNLCISGLYLWAKAFGGTFDFPVFPEQTEEFNLLHINITPRNIPLVFKVLPWINRKKTKLLMNVDHSVSMWSNAFPYTQEFLHVLDQADYIFAVEPFQSEILSDALKRTVPCIPHPVEIDQLKKLRSTQREQRIGLSVHRYDANTVLPWYALNELPSGWLPTVIGAGTIQPQPKLHHLYPEIQPHLPFEELAKFVSQLYAMIETYTISSYGRLTVECAAMGVPVIGSSQVASQLNLFPSTTTTHFSPIKIKHILKSLIHDQDFYTHVVNTAAKSAEKYSLENSKQKLLSFLNSKQ